jgi:TRAP-type C4-dicarboxylate transport system permease small subunit
MDAADADRFPLKLRRADFIALTQVVAGSFFALLGGWYALTDGIAVESVANAAVAVLWFVIAGYQHARPASMDRGTDPTPRRWVELAALVGGTLAAMLVAAFAIELWAV